MNIIHTKLCLYCFLLGRMLLDFVDLAPGDWVVQNGANSAVGQSLDFQYLPFVLIEWAVIFFQVNLSSFSPPRIMWACCR